MLLFHFICVCNQYCLNCDFCIRCLIYEERKTFITIIKVECYLSKLDVENYIVHKQLFIHSSWYLFIYTGGTLLGVNSFTALTDGFTLFL